MVEMVQSSHSDTNVRPESPDNPITNRVHTITLDAKLPAPQSPQMIQQITTLQIPQQHDMETIRQSIEDFSLPHLLKARTCMIPILMGIILRVIRCTFCTAGSIVHLQTSQQPQLSHQLPLYIGVRKSLQLHVGTYDISCQSHR